ncbi:MAG: hypothetical protein E7670_08670 [Ruminococcaceae bacterium]|nr:hypothetical protein [Oscillospiraceae bacterium]
MERLNKIGKIKAKNSKEVINSKIGLGFEKLDRDVFDPEKAYDRVAELGIKWIRIQSGWQRTEREKGVYDFAWLDKVVDNLIARGLKPWICLCYGNDLYDDLAKTVFGAVGCPPIFTEEQKAAWAAYVKATVEHYRGRVSYYEIWNEPDGIWCWKTGVNATELGEFTRDTGKLIKEIDPSIKVIGGVICERPIAYLNQALAAGMGEYIDFISFHEYTHDETRVFERVNTLRALGKRYNPSIEVIQGESGSQSRSGGHGALHVGAWTQEKQAKQLARHTIADLLTDVHFSSYFSCVDMIEALNGTVGDVNSYLDYGYFGVLGAEFDESGKSIGTYVPKLSYYVLQNIASIFSEDPDLYELPAIFIPRESRRYFGRDLERSEITVGGFKNESGELMAYWAKTDIMHSSYEGTISFQMYSEYESVRLINIMDGSIYEIPESIVKRDAYGCFHFSNLPAKDTPLLLEFGNFIKQ